MCLLYGGSSKRQASLSGKYMHAMSRQGYLSEYCHTAILPQLKVLAGSFLPSHSYTQLVGQCNIIHMTHMEDEMKHFKRNPFDVVTSHILNITSFLYEICQTFCQQQHWNGKTWPRSANHRKLGSATSIIGPAWMKWNTSRGVYLM